MKAISRRFFISAAFCLSAVLCGCIVKFEVPVVNHTTEPVVLRVAQYHSEGFDGMPPRQFSRALMVWQRDVRLAPNEKSKLEFNSGSGGFWLRWTLLDSSGKEGKWATLDLIRDKRAIHIRQTGKS